MTCKLFFYKSNQNQRSENPMEIQQSPIQQFYQTLVDESKQIGLRYQAVFELKNMATTEAIKRLMDAYQYCKGSVLLKHELLYALGQLDPKVVDISQFKDFLIKKVNDQQENNLSRHQAAQALANYYLPELQELYKEHLKSSCNQLRWTCQIAIEKVKNKQLEQKYGLKYSATKQPAAPFSQQEFQNFLKEKSLEKQFKSKGFLEILLNEQISLFEKYRIMYYMRDLNNMEIIQVLCKLLSKQHFKSQTSLLKHEICFILGQIGCGNCQNLVRECIQNQQEEEIVRHEALAAVASQSKDVDYLQKFINDESRLIRESAQVAQFTIKYWN